MESNSKLAGSPVKTPMKERIASSKTKFIEKAKHSENIDPNLSSQGLKSTDSCKSAKKLASRNPNQPAFPFPKKKIRDRKFVIAKKKSRKEESECEKCNKGIGKSRCLCVAYESLRASQEGFFKNREIEDLEKNEAVEEISPIEETKEENGGLSEENGESGSKRRHDKMLDVPEPGSGRVMHLVKAFENLQLLKKSDETEEKDESEKVEEEDSNNNTNKGNVLGSSFCPSDFFLTSESLGLDSNRSYSLDSSQGSITARSCAGGRKSRRSSAESAGTLNRRYWKRKQQRATSQKPFMLRTEQRGRSKEEEFMKKLQQMMQEEEKLRVPIAQGLPWTTDEPECLVKPPVKEITRPVDLVLHTDSRAVERAEFDHQVAKKMDLIEQYRMERERQQKMAEEEEIRRLRKELVPKAQPMPYFDRPFIPKRDGAKGRAGSGNRPLKVCEAPNNTKRAKVPSPST